MCTCVTFLLAGCSQQWEMHRMTQLAQSSQLAYWISHFGRVIYCLPGKTSYFKHLLLFSTVNKHAQASSHLFCLCAPEHLPGPLPGWCSLEDPPERNSPGFGAEMLQGMDPLLLLYIIALRHFIMPKLRLLFTKRRSNLCGWHINWASGTPCTC